MARTMNPAGAEKKEREMEQGGGGHPLQVNAYSENPSETPGFTYDALSHVRGSVSMRSRLDTRHQIVKNRD